jgi:hypothetical protein
MRFRTIALLGFVLLAASMVIDAQQTIYWKKDHIYAGAGAKEIAVVTPTPSPADDDVVTLTAVLAAE